MKLCSCRRRQQVSSIMLRVLAAGSILHSLFRRIFRHTFVFISFRYIMYSLGRFFFRFLFVLSDGSWTPHQSSNCMRTPKLRG